jgi:hypothetical protein
MDDPFEAVSFMRARREEIDKEDEGLSWEERRRKTLDNLQDDPLWRRLEDRFEPAETPITSESNED